MTAPDEPDDRVRCPTCGSPVHVVTADEYEMQRTNRQYLCLDDDTYFGALPELSQGDQP